MALFKNKPQQTSVSPRQSLEIKYNSARGNLLMVIVFTVVNILLLVTNSNSYFLFSAFVPYILVENGWYYTGKYPVEAYGEYYSDMAFAADVVLYVLIAVAVIVLAVYFLCWLFSKKQRAGWIVVALVFFALDTVGYLLYAFMYGMLDMSSVIDILFHAWVIYYLVGGLVANAKLKKLPAEEELPEEAAQEPAVAEETNINE
ncbi:MAG: hypothetical protein IJB57_08835 [Clostridia bacterium]|nr:hypothetical protein [Clostridia bacterium]